MRYLIASDIHGSFEDIKKILFNNKFDILILLGDILNGPYDIDTMNKTADLLNIFKNKIIYVKGNCDTYLNDKLEFYNNDLYRYILIDKKTWFITHGHAYNRYSLIDKDYDIFISGHTHKYLLEKSNNKYYINPGSCTLPRGSNIKTFIIYENNIFYLYDIDNILINKMEIK